MPVTAIQTQTERKEARQVCLSGRKTRSRARMMRLRGLTRPAPGVSATTFTARGEKHLFRGQIQATFLSGRRPLGECRFIGLEEAAE